MASVLYWVTATAALIGVWLNIHRHLACFFIWAGTNAVWAAVDYRHGIYGQAGLQAVYFLLSLYGIWKWRRRK
ncbi:MAG: nicotinamide mononucleotide transporter [Planctomycetes bacterium]|nr:nicotinamide mononucleotide transporter [Planctomycetota bacterium]